MALPKLPPRVIFTPKKEIKYAQTSTGGQLHNMKIKRDLKFIKYELATACTLWSAAFWRQPDSGIIDDMERFFKWNTNILRV